MPDDVGLTSISLRVPTDVLEKLDKVAAAMERSRTWVCLHALRQYLADEGAEVLDVQEGIAQLERGERTPLAEVMADLGELIAEAEAKRTTG